VAGGAGEVSFHLANAHGISGTVVDPRPPKLYGCVRRWEMGMYQSKGERRCKGQNSENDDGGGGLCGIDHVPLYVGEALLGAVLSSSGGGREGARDKLEFMIQEDLNSFRAEVPPVVLAVGVDISGKSDSAESGDQQVKPNADKERRLRVAANIVRTIHNPSDILDRLMNFSCIVGMHPDQGTEFVIDLALAKGRPFAVVPCCVCGRQFPGRQLRDGTEVGSSYERFLTYLMEKDPEKRIQRATLDFGGKNQVLYRFASDFVCAKADYGNS